MPDKQTLKDIILEKYKEGNFKSVTELVMQINGKWLTEKLKEKANKPRIVTQIDEEGCPYEHEISNPRSNLLHELLEETKP